MNEQTVPRDETQMTNKHMRRCSTSPGIRKMEIKTTWILISPQSEWNH